MTTATITATAPTTAAPPVGAASLRFVIGGVDYAVPLRAIHSVEPFVPLTWLPFAPPWLVGLAAAGGQVLTVVDLGPLLGAPRLGQPRYLVVVGHGGALLALAAEAVRGIERLDLAEPMAAGLDRAGQLGSIVGVRGRADGAVTVLDVAGLFDTLFDAPVDTPFGTVKGRGETME